jgi:hypothetical protein
VNPSVLIGIAAGAAAVVLFASAVSFVPLDALQAVPKNTTDASNVPATIFL